MQPLRRSEHSVNKTTLNGRALTSGVAEGEALVTREPFGFAHGIEPATGEITDMGHEWRGKDVRGKILVFPYGKGSATGGMFVLEAAKQDNVPAAVINLETDPITATGFIMAEILYNKEIPVIDRLEQNPIELIKTGDRVKVDANKGIVEIYHKRKQKAR